MKSNWADWISLGMVVLILVGICTPHPFWRAALLVLGLAIALALVILTAAELAGGRHGKS